MKKDKTIRERLIPIFLVSTCIPIILFAVFSMFRLSQSVDENTELQIENNLKQADQSLKRPPGCSHGPGKTATWRTHGTPAISRKPFRTSSPAAPPCFKNSDKDRYRARTADSTTEATESFSSWSEIPESTGAMNEII